MVFLILYYQIRNEETLEVHIAGESTVALIEAECTNLVARQTALMIRDAVVEAVGVGDGRVVEVVLGGLREGG